MLYTFSTVREAMRSLGDVNYKITLKMLCSIVTRVTSSIKSNNFCGRCRSWAAFIALGHWSLAVHLFAVPSNRKRVYNSLSNEKLSCKGISSFGVKTCCVCVKIVLLSSVLSLCFVKILTMDVVDNLINIKRFVQYTYAEKIDLKRRGRPLPDIVIEAGGISRGRAFKRLQ
jgi:hypothetical protein